LPFTAGGLCISVLRNYFAAHPWMAASVIILGLIATLKLQLAFQPPKAAKEKKGCSRIVCASIALVSLIYSFLVIEFLKLNSSTADSISLMIKSHTQRGDLILFDPAVFGDRPVEQWLGTLCDRTIINDKNLASVQRNAGSRFFVLATNSGKDGLREVSKTSDFGIESSQTLLVVLELYRKIISRRVESDSPLPAEVYYLCSPAIP
jgi:predicted PurR-regulated permease PerM